MSITQRVDSMLWSGELESYTYLDRATRRVCYDSDLNSVVGKYDTMHPMLTLIFFDAHSI